MRLLLFERPSTECCHALSGTFSYPIDVYRAITEQPCDVFLELSAIVLVLQDVSQYGARQSPLCSMCHQCLEPNSAMEAVYNLTSWLSAKFVKNLIEQTTGATDQGGCVARAP